MFHAFLFNIKSYSVEVSNTQRCEADLNTVKTLNSGHPK